MNKYAFSILILLGTLLLGAGSASAGAGGLKVIATIRPLHSLVAGVMHGLGTPKLLIESGSAHTYTVKPSDAQALEQAQLVFWIGPELENFLRRPLATLATKAKLITLSDTEGLKLLKTRSAAHGYPGAVDMHLWLDPDNAKKLTRRIVKVLARTDPSNAEAYEANGAYQIDKLTELTSDIEEILASAGDVKSIFYHDAFQYFEQRFGLKSAGFVTTGSNRAPGARHVRTLRETILSGGADCVLTEPQFAPSLLPSLTKNSRIQVGVLDPIGAGWVPGTDLYFNMMRHNAEALRKCAAGNPPPAPGD